MNKIQLMMLISGFVVILAGLGFLTVFHDRTLGFVLLAAGFISVVNAFIQSNNNKR